MRVYRWKLVGYDLYYQPGNGGSNLGPTGKIYARKPARPTGMAFVSESLLQKHSLSGKPIKYKWKTYGIQDPKWELKEYEMQEVS